MTAALNGAGGDMKPQDKIELKIITPRGVALDVRISSATLPASDGSFGVMPSHAPMLASLAPGDIAFISEGKPLSFRIESGIAEIKNDIITVLTGYTEGKQPS